jgi:hypothetical protein
VHNSEVVEVVLGVDALALGDQRVVLYLLVLLERAGRVDLVSTVVVGEELGKDQCVLVRQTLPGFDIRKHPIVLSAGLLEGLTFDLH